jgi:hypothetical protein
MGLKMASFWLEITSDLDVSSLIQSVRFLGSDKPA